MGAVELALIVFIVVNAALGASSLVALRRRAPRNALGGS